jgi:DNA topoisomerase-1
MHAAAALRELGPAPTKKAAEKNIKLAVDRTAAMLGNTRSVCRKYYIHPALLEAYLDGSVLPPEDKSGWRERQRSGPTLRHHEAEVLAFLKARLDRTATPAGSAASAPAA